MKTLKFRSEYVKVSYAVRRISERWGVNPSWVWDIFEDWYNFIKGCNCLTTEKEAKEVEAYICDEIMHGRA